jgi:hypothetical protein
MAYLIFENNNMKFFTQEDPNSDSCLIQLNENSVVKEVDDDLDIVDKLVTLVDGEVDIQDIVISETLDIDTLRFHRDQKLKETDLWGLQDYPSTEEQLAYRQALRDITSTYTSLGDVVWPTKPE